MSPHRRSPDTLSGGRALETFKPYSIARAELIAHQLSRFATQHVHQLAGHHANLPFWLEEAAGAIRLLDQYPARFRALRDAQMRWVRTHGTTLVVYCPICRGGCELGPRPPPRPWRIRSEDLEAARRSVRDAVERLLARLYRARFVSEEEARRHAEDLGVPMESEDFRGDDQ